MSRTPVIFIAPDDSYNIMKGYEVGGVDYIPVPFKEPEVLGRIGAHVRIIKLQEEIVDQRRSFEEKIQKEVQDITATQMATIFSLAKLAQSRMIQGFILSVFSAIALFLPRICQKLQNITRILMKNL